MGTRTQGPSTPKGNRKAAADQGGGLPVHADPVVDAPVPPALAQPLPVAGTSTDPVHVDGFDCSSLYALIIPAAHVITPDAGSFEIGRVYYDFPVIGGGKGPIKVFECGHGHNKLAGRTIEKVRILTNRGLFLYLSGGVQVFVPYERLQLTYTVAGPF